MTTMRAARLITVVLSLFVGGCMTADVGTSAMVSVPKDGVAQCEKHCGQMGLRLSAVAIMANDVGCVCLVPAPAGLQAAPGPQADAGALPAGMATIALLQRRQQQQPQQQK